MASNLKLQRGKKRSGRDDYVIEEKLVDIFGNNYNYSTHSDGSQSRHGLNGVDDVALKVVMKERIHYRLCLCYFIFLLLLTVLGLYGHFWVLPAETEEIEEPTIYSENELEELIYTFSSVESLRNITSPQYKAMTWMITLEKQYNNNTNATVSCHNNKDLLRQAYVMAVLYYSLNGDEWHTNREWLSSTTNICGWYSSYHKYRSICDQNGMLRLLHLDNNNLNGTLPTELGHLSLHLREINFERNQIHGNIPSEFSGMTRLQLLSLSQNNLIGTVPIELGGMTALKFLSIQSNNLAGVIPSEVCRLHQLFNLKRISSDCNTDQNVICNCSPCHCAA